ncbi:Vacuolar protein sorting-associated protein 4 [Irineochytrium annulatum]|nr:Vacuolar protein sorting-associated protein 4 [Irineochytrium annulatum]
MDYNLADVARQTVDLTQRWVKKLAASYGGFPNGTLIHGPPGTGKTTFFSAVRELGLDVPYICLRSLDIIEDTTAALNRVENAIEPTVLFIDDFDFFFDDSGQGGGGVKGREAAQMLMEMLEEQRSNVLLFAISDAPWKISAFGAKFFSMCILVNLPTKDDRLDMLRKEIEGWGDGIEVDLLKQVVEITDGFTNADISTVVKYALQRSSELIQCADHFKKVQVPIPDCPGEFETKLTPCSATADGAMPMTWSDMDPEDMKEPELTYDVLMRAAMEQRKAVEKADTALARYVVWEGKFLTK